ncbi:hypothetical protein Tco_0199674 [Tanacetum coccineum]
MDFLMRQFASLYDGIQVESLFGSANQQVHLASSHSPVMIFSVVVEGVLCHETSIVLSSLTRDHNPLASQQALIPLVDPNE